MKKVVFFLSLILLITISACTSNANSPAPVSALKSITSEMEFKTLVNAQLENASGNLAWFRSTGMVTTDALFATAEVSTDDSASEVSSTNVQIEGVDEGDIIKVDANRIYRIDGERFFVVEINQGQMTLIYETTLETTSESSGYSFYSDLYLTDQYVVVIGQRYDFYAAIETDEIRILPIFRFGTPFTLINVYDKDTLNLVDQFEVSGSLNTSRLIEDQLYVLSYHSIYLLDDAFDPRPVIRINGEESVPEYSEIKYIENVATEAFTMMIRLDLSDEPVLDTDILLGSMGWGQVYVNLEGIYFAASRYVEIQRTGINQRTLWSQQGQLISYTFNPDGSLSFGGVGDYQGWIQNQFWMDEHEGFFRLVTTEGFGDDVVNRLYIFERQMTEEGPVLETISMIDEGLGKPRETVRSVRFQKDLATVVTFEITDPLYTIDLSDPFNPVILAGLEITGFATYQHPWHDDTLIGIGYETDLDGMIIGLKLTLFDLSDTNNPVEIGEPLLLLSGPNNWQFSEALHNHKAILIAKDQDFLGFSIRHSRYLRDRNSTSEDYLIFFVDASLDQPIQIAQTINHDAFASSDINPWAFRLERAVYVDDILYVISTLGITSHQISDDFSSISEFEFE